MTGLEDVRFHTDTPQPVGSHVEGHLELHNIYLGPDNQYRNKRSTKRLTSTGYHSDVSYERQPPGITILTLLSVPPTGGDTGWASQTAAYARLSPPIKALLEGLRAEHSGFPQAENARRDGKFVRREPVTTEHPIVRVHPATGQKALFVNPGFTKRIVGLKDEESDALLKLLFTVSYGPLSGLAIAPSIHISLSLWHQSLHIAPLLTWPLCSTSRRVKTSKYACGGRREPSLFGTTA